MRKTAFAFFMLIAGAAMGLLVGLTIGSGQAVSPSAAAAGWDGIPHSGQLAPLDRSTAGMPDTAAQIGKVQRTSIEPSLEELLAPVDVSASSPSGQLIAGIVASAEGADSGREAADGSVDLTQSITGLVIDNHGLPLAGVTVITVMNPEASIVRTRSSDSIGQDWDGEGDLAESLRSRAASEFKQRRMRRVALSDEEGHFTLTQLLPGSHYVKAYAEGYVFSLRRTHVGTSTTLTGTPAEQFHLEVVDEEGTPLKEAIIGVSNKGRWTYYDWTAEEPQLPLKERSALLKAFAGGPLIGDSKAPFAKLASKARRIYLDTEGYGPHRFTVKPTPSLCVTVVDQTTDGPTLPHTVRYAGESALTKAGGRSAFRKASKKVQINGDGRYRVGTLQPGDYVLGVSRGTDDPEVFREFTVADGPVKETIELPPVRSDDFWVVKAYSPNGVLLSGLRFSIWTLQEDRVRTTTPNSVERSRGEHWVPRPGTNGSWEGPPRLVVRSATYGSLMTPVGLDQDRVRVDFLEPCDLRVDVAGDPDKTFKITLRVKENLGSVASSFLVNADPKLTKGSGFVTFHGLQPALAELSLRPEDASSWGNNHQLALIEVPLRSGDQLATLSPATLHTLEIHAPDEAVGTQFSLVAVRAPGALNIGGVASGRLGEDHTVRLTKLNSGRYTLKSHARTTPPMDVSVPSGTLVYERPATVGYRVSSQSKKRGLAPLAEGDIVTAVNGESVAVGSVTSRIRLAVGDGETTLTLLRDGKSMELPLTEYPKNVSFYPVASLK